MSNFSTYYSTLNNDTPSYSSNRLKSICLLISCISGLETGQHNIISLIWQVWNFSTYSSTLNNDPHLKNICLCFFFTCHRRETSQRNIISILWRILIYYSTLNNHPPSFFPNRINCICWLIFRRVWAGDKSALFYLTAEKVRRILPPIFCLLDYDTL